MAAVSATTIQQHLDAGRNGHTTTEKGRALEDLICYVLGLVPGIAITHRNELNAFESEEIDVAIWNNKHADGFPFLPHVFLVECKNWSKRVARVGSSSWSPPASCWHWTQPMISWNSSRRRFATWWSRGRSADARSSFVRRGCAAGGDGYQLAHSIKFVNELQRATVTWPSAPVLPRFEA